MKNQDAPEPISLADKMQLVERLWTPHRIAKFDGHQLVLARLEGSFVWHEHADHDEVFMPLTGTLILDFEGEQSRSVGPGEVLVVPKGVRHRPRTEAGEVTLLVIDPLDVRHTGDTKSEMTVETYPEI